MMFILIQLAVITLGCRERIVDQRKRKIVHRTKANPCKTTGTGGSRTTKHLSTEFKGKDQANEGLFQRSLLVFNI